MSNLAFVKACYNELYGGGPAPTKATVQSHLASAVHCHDYDNGFNSSVPGDIADHLLSIRPEVKEHPSATFKEDPTGVVYCLDHMTRPNAGSCLDRVTVVDENGQPKISDIEICYLESP